MTEGPIYSRINYWVQNYGLSGIPDQKAVENFIECETTEAVRLLRFELELLAQGKFNQDSLDHLVGVKRRVKHESYDAWAKLMLQWIAGYKG
ncbi:MAG: hypothetical protein J0M12_10195 [Deltaproteobacteria bacterium]|nr:hypothetical protein [Deltaproteobacteria bacterium]